MFALNMIAKGFFWNLKYFFLQVFQVMCSSYFVSGSRIFKNKIAKAEIILDKAPQVVRKAGGVFVDKTHPECFG